MRAQIIGAAESKPAAILSRGTSFSDLNSSATSRQIGHTLDFPDPDRFVFLLVAWNANTSAGATYGELAPPGWSLTDGGPYNYTMTQHYLYQQGTYDSRRCSLGIWSLYIPDGTGTLYVSYPLLSRAVGSLHIYRVTVRMPRRIVQSVSSTNATNATLALTGTQGSIALMHGYVEQPGGDQHVFSSAVNNAFYNYTFSTSIFFCTAFSADSSFNGSYTADLNNDASNRIIRMAGVVI